MIPLSYSGLKDLECPFRFKALKIDRSHKEPETEALKVGSAIADLLARYRRHCHANGLPSDLGYLDKQKEFNVEIGIVDKVRDLASKFARSEFAVIATGAEWVHVESQPTQRFEQIGGYAFNDDLRFMGSNKAAWLHKDVAFRLKCDYHYYDPAERALVIVDDKSGWGDGDEQQLAIYAHLVKVAWLQLPITATKPLEKISCTFNNLAKGTTTTIEFSPDDTEPMRQHIIDAIKDVNSRSEWPAVACSRCSFCSVTGCPIRESAEKALVSSSESPALSIPSSISTSEEAEKALLFVEFAESVAGTVKGLLRSYVDEHGPVTAMGKVAGYTEKESVKTKDLAGLCAALVSFGAPKELVWKELSLTRSALKKIVKKAKLEAKQPWIDAYLDKSTIRSFGITRDKTY